MGNGKHVKSKRLVYMLVTGVCGLTWCEEVRVEKEAPSDTPKGLEKMRELLEDIEIIPEVNFLVNMSI